MSGFQGLRGRLVMGGGNCVCGCTMATWQILWRVEVFCIMTISMSVSWLWNCAVAWQDVTTGRNWVKGTMKFLCFIPYKLHVNLQIPQNKNKSIILKNKLCCYIWTEVFWTKLSMLIKIMNKSICGHTVIIIHHSEKGEMTLGGRCNCILFCFWKKACVDSHWVLQNTKKASSQTKLNPSWKRNNLNKLPKVSKVVCENLIHLMEKWERVYS